MEGVCRVLGEHLAGATADEPVVLTGDITKSAVWCQIAADMWQQPLMLADPRVSYAAQGSALLAGVTAGLYPSVEAAVSFLEADQQ